MRGISFSMQCSTIFAGRRLLDRYCAPKTRAWLRQTSLDQALLGSVAGSMTAFTDNPMCLLKCRAQTTTAPEAHSETLQAYYRAAMAMYRQHGGGLAGVRSLYLAGHINMFQRFLSWGTFYYVYDVMRKRDYGPLVAGPAGGVASWLVVYPFEVLLTRIMTTDPRLQLAYQDHYRSFLRLPARHWYPGLSLTLARSVPQYAITFFVLETLELAWERRQGVDFDFGQ